MKETTAWQLSGQPKDFRMFNVCCDCPHCGREEWFMVLKSQTLNVVCCQFNEALDPLYAYLLLYPPYEYRAAPEPLRSAS